MNPATPTATLTMPTFGSLPIGPDQPPFIIAEMSGNHNQSLERALAIVDAAAEAGAHALKLQTFKADDMTLDIAAGEFMANPDGPWRGKTLHAVYRLAETPWEWHAPLFERCRERGLVPLSSPFSSAAVDFLESLDCPAYKIASFENTDTRLIRHAAATGKPLIISTGMATLAELDECVRTAREAGCANLVLLKCTSSYPAEPADSHLRTIPHMRELFACEVGLSDHTLGIGAAVASVALGATVIEKHFTLSRAEGGVDAAFSLEPDEFARLVEETGRAWQALGGVRYGPTAAEENARARRRSLYVVEDIEAGQPFTEHNLRAIRPGLGLPTRYLDRLLGKPARRAFKRGTPLSLEDLL